MPKEAEERRYREVLENMRDEYPGKSEKELEYMARAVVYGKRKGMKRGR